MGCRPSPDPNLVETFRLWRRSGGTSLQFAPFIFSARGYKILTLTRISFDLKPISPFRLDLTVWTLRRRPSYIVDRWDGTTYNRVLVLHNRPVEIGVQQIGAPERPRLRVEAAGPRLVPEAQAEITSVLERLLGIRIDLSPFYQFAAADAQLGPLAARYRGMKPPRYTGVFEGLVNAIACQQITLTQGLTLLSRLAEHYGVATQQDGTHAFPRPEDLLAAQPAALRRLGYSENKTRALLELARAVVAGQVNFQILQRMDNARAIAYLTQLRGVGRWTAEYVLLRGLGRLDVFPGDDVGGRNNLVRWLKRDELRDYAGVRAALAPWQPYAGLIYLHLLLDRLAAAGYVE